jgi:hypothetical protein
MHPDYRASAPGVCPRCGMKLVPGIPERIELPLELTHVPAIIRPNEKATLRLRVLEPSGRAVERHFEIVHEKLMHVFLVSESLEYFAHLHPVLQDDGSFELPVCLPEGGMYRLLRISIQPDRYRNSQWLPSSSAAKRCHNISLPRWRLTERRI